MYQRFHGDIIAGEQMLASKSTQSSLKGMPQSALVMAMCMCSNNFKVANLKRPKSELLFLSFFFLSFFLQPVQRCNVKSVAFKTATSSQGILCGWCFCTFKVFVFECSCDITQALFRLWGQSCWTLFCWSTCADKCVGSTVQQKRAETRNFKRFL